MEDLFPASDDAVYTPLPTPGFSPHRIVLAQGSRTTPGRRAVIEQICQAYPEAEVIDQPEVPHNRIDPGEADVAAALRLGKQTLVLGEHRSAVRQSREEGNTCPN